jgi:hypothetical protein
MIDPERIEAPSDIRELLVLVSGATKTLEIFRPFKFNLSFHWLCEVSPGVIEGVPGLPVEAGGEVVPAQREMENGRSPLVSIPPFGREFSRHLGLPIRCGSGRSAKGDFRARLHRLDEPARLSLGVVASPQSLLPFHLAEPL